MNGIKEILSECFKAGQLSRHNYGLKEEVTFDMWLKENEDKILALGKPEPLAKNKQTENSFLCDMEFTLGDGNKCKNECITCRNNRLENECRDATSR